MSTVQQVRTRNITLKQNGEQDNKSKNESGNKNDTAPGSPKKYKPFNCEP